MRLPVAWAALAAVAAGLGAAPATAQWTDPQPNLPRKADGSFDPAAAVPRLPDGTPDLSGIYTASSSMPWDLTFIEREGGYAVESGSASIGVDTPYKPWALEVTKRRFERKGLDDPQSYCRPGGYVVMYGIPSSPIKIIHKPGLLVMLYEATMSYRQVFLDGRKLPEDAIPTYNGYSVGHWDGDTLVIESAGFNANFWIDGLGSPVTEQLRVTERVTRNAFGKIDIEMMIDDPVAYTKPWPVHVDLTFRPDGDIIETYCEMNEFEDQVEQLEFEPELGPVEPPPEEVEAAIAARNAGK